LDVVPGLGVVTVPRQRRKRAELSSKLAGFTSDLELWLAESKAGGASQKHHTQIRRVAAQLRPLADRLDRSIGDHPDGQWHLLEQNLMDLHQVWGYFREKFALRRLPEYADYLRLADEFCWACYRPAQTAVVNAGKVEPGAVREPPLVYLSSSADPFSIARNETYGEEIATAGLSSRSARLLVRRLPVPVIGVPWFQPHHLPDVLLIGHEVGHIVLNEMIGPEAVRDLVSAAVESDARPGPPAHWGDWSEEAFADVYGALCGGEAYLTVLADFLGDQDGPVGADDRYPPAASRLALCREALRQAGTGVPEPGEDLTQRVARTLVDSRYPAFGDKRLDEVMPPAGQGGDTFSELLAGWDPATRDVRTLVAVAAQAFAENPEGYRASGARELVLTQAQRIQSPGTRYRGGGTDADLAAIAAGDAAAAADLWLALTVPTDGAR
jgi:hypothetical protein